ncbi:MAG TPA: CDP-alcohol phosphatidyltransferase family protein [Myxococcota bacterium]|nr:CDP-alcohol phosphatidyltransferase family protein [Myxococcota bacterium]
MIKEKFGDRLDRVVHRLFPFLFWRPLNPNLLSVLGAAVSVGAASAFLAGHLRTGGWMMIASGFFDLVDGAVARHNGTASTFGAFLDSTLDRLVDVAVLVGMIMFYAGRGSPRIAVIASIALVATVLVSYAKARAEVVMGSLDAGFFERGERMGILALGAVTGFLPVALGVVAAGASITALQRIAIAHREMAKIDAARVGEGRP